MAVVHETVRYEIPEDIQERLEDRVVYFLRLHASNQRALNRPNLNKESFEYGQLTGLSQAHEWFLQLFGQAQVLSRSTGGHTIETAPIPVFTLEHADALRERHDLAFKDLQNAEKSGVSGFTGGLAAGYHYGINEVLIELGLSMRRMRRDYLVTS